MSFCFINNGTDDRVLKSMNAETPSDDLIKAMNKAGLVQKDVQVRGKNHIYTRKQWVKANEVEVSTVGGSGGGKPPRDSYNRHEFIKSKFDDPHNLFMNFRTGNQTTFEEITETFRINKELQKRYKSIDNFIKSNYFVSNGNNETKDVYRISMGVWDEKRVKSVHQPIINNYLENSDTPPEGKKPICFLYGGGSGSGKSTVVKAIAEPIIQATGLKFCKVDCDSIKEMLPEHNMFVQQNVDTAAFREHRESSDIANNAIDALINAGKCFQYDGTMSDTEKYRAIIGKLKKAGYEVHIVATDIPVDEAIRRAAGRDRKIPDEIVHKTHREFAKNFLNICSLEGVDSFALYDNTQPEGQPNRCIFDDKGLYYEDLYERFLNKSQES